MQKHCVGKRERKGAERKGNLGTKGEALNWMSEPILPPDKLGEEEEAMEARESLQGRLVWPQLAVIPQGKFKRSGLTLL